MEEIYFLLTDTGTVFNRTIKFYTKDPYNHVSISLDKEFNELYSFGRKVPYNPFKAGFVKEELDGIYTYFKNTSCAIYSMKVPSSSYKKMFQIIEDFKHQPLRYNLIGLVAAAFNKPMKRESAYFCSQFVAVLLKESGVYLFTKDPSLVKPSDFQKCQRLTLVYEGKLSNYNTLFLQKVSMI